VTLYSRAIIVVELLLTSQCLILPFAWDDQSPKCVGSAGGQKTLSSTSFDELSMQGHRMWKRHPYGVKPVYIFKYAKLD
jgi:hypothetical protein